ncbi:MarR family transcriptional regulator [Nonomuraea sp. B12E4]|uniref:MarR family winged helix-turn-helix transcriptional regulator n=1 Tax=Nonomuraea sp. B12E4 TaxID=3153564 RepID=UPI00325CF895
MTCEPSNATFIVDKLERQGLIERRAHPTDRRAKLLVLTAEGDTTRERLLELLVEDSPLAGLTADQQRVPQDLLEQAVPRA